MPDSETAGAAGEVSVAQQTFNEITQPFIDLFRANRALWGINLSYLLEGLTYFGVVGLLAIFFNDYIGLNDIDAGHMVGFLTAGITLGMLFMGATVDLIGPRRALLLSLSLMLIGRVLLTVSPDLGTKGLWSSSHWLAMGGLFGVVLGYGIYQPACYAAVRQFTSAKNAAMGYAMLYALMNLGGFLPGLISPPVRHAYGITGVFWVYVALTVAGIAVIAIFLTRSATAAATAEAAAERQEAPPAEAKKTLKEQTIYYLKNFPLRDGRFMFFIFILVPVQTLFAHNWLTLPQYCYRAFSGLVSDNFEFFVNFNPILIFILTPIVTALTTKKDTYTMMIVGTLIMGAPTFILALGPSVGGLFAFLVLMTIGEATLVGAVPPVGGGDRPEGHDGNLHGDRAVPLVPDEGRDQPLQRLVPDALLPGRRPAGSAPHRDDVVHLRPHRHDDPGGTPPCVVVDAERLPAEGRRPTSPIISACSGVFVLERQKTLAFYFGPL
ncbi:MAG TPA: MFS transporter [Bacteroidota bacterium]|nr:MFS transporter [Bacteroidota bacterium]